MSGFNLTLAGRALVAMGVTSGAMLVAFLGLSWFGFLQHGRTGIAAAAVACGVCWIGGVTALSATFMFRNPQDSWQGLLLAMLFRMGLPLAVSMELQSSRSKLLGAGVIGMLVGTYLLGLFVETLLAWWIVETTSGATAPGTAKAS